MTNDRQKILTKAELKQFRALAHKLSPIVSVASNGLSDSVIAELERALNDHELIKIKVAVGERQLRDEMIAQLCDQTGAALVQRIGNTCTIVRRSTDADPRKSNLKRAL